MLKKLDEGKTTIYCNRLDEKTDLQPILVSIGISHPLFHKSKAKDRENWFVQRKELALYNQKKIFISYAHHNSNWLRKLDTHLSGLKRSGSIESWTDQEIPAGDKCNDEIKEQLAAADIFNCFLSPDFAASDYIWNTEAQIIFNNIREEKKRVLFVYTESFDLGSLQSIGITDFEMIPKDKQGKLKATDSWSKESEVMAIIAKRIREVVETG